jgi:hypothetical protein
MGNSNSQALNNKKVNSILNKISKSTELLCDSKCQERKKLNKLKTDYINAKKKLNDTPHNYEDAYRKYLDFKEGPGTYAAIKKKKETAELLKEKQEIYDDFIIKLNNTMGQYNQLLQQELYNSHADEIISRDEETLASINNGIIKQTDEKNTENRFSYYQNKDLERNLSILKYVKYLYFTLFTIFFLYFILFKGNGNTKMYIISAVLLIYPFVIKWSYDKVLRVYSFIRELFMELKR